MTGHSWGCGRLRRAGGRGSSMACSSWGKHQALLVLLLLPSLLRGVSTQTFTADVESKINHLAFFLSKRRRGLCNLVAVKISKKPCSKTKGCEVLKSPGLKARAARSPLRLCKPFCAEGSVYGVQIRSPAVQTERRWWCKCNFQTLHSYTVIEDQLFRYIRNRSC